MDLGISGKRALVIGGSQGIGYAVAEALAGEGVNLLIFARNKERLDGARQKLKAKFPVSVEVFAGDISKEDEVSKLGTFVDQQGGVDILIVNTTRPPSPMRDLLDETEAQRWEDGYKTQLYGAILILREIAPRIMKRGWGRVVAITSASVKHPMPRHAISSIFRAGVHAAIKHLANESATTGMTANCIAPASIHSESFAMVHNLDDRIKRVPMGRLGTVEEFAGTVLFYCSKQSGFITGSTVQVDGGMTASLL